MKNRKQAVLEVAKKGDFDNVVKIEGKWNGCDVWTPCGTNGETLYIGAVCFVDDGTEVKPYMLNEAEAIFREVAESLGIKESDFCE